ncbi:MAG: hypothetical protein IPN01_04560 [Deltaproteobacteria bacterium]|nr:hypothetical protein [Deltaproteobacteria bacterium]
MCWASAPSPRRCTKAAWACCPKTPLLPERHTARDFLRFMGELQGLSAGEAKDAAERAIQSVDLNAG